MQLDIEAQSVSNPEPKCINGLYTLAEALRDDDRSLENPAFLPANIFSFCIHRNLPFVLSDHARAFVLAKAGATIQIGRNFLHFDKLCQDLPNSQSLEEGDKGEVDSNGSAEDDPFVRYTDGILDLVRPNVLHRLRPVSFENVLAVPYVSSPSR